MTFPTHHCDVIVGNIGTVSHRVSRSEAERVFREYVKMSKGGVGSASGESVIVVDSESGDPIRTYYSPKACGADSL